MAWYYRDGEQVNGPVEKNELQKLINSGRIDRQTLVWNEATSQWCPLGEMVKGSASDGASHPPPVPEPPPAVTGQDVPAEAAETAPAVTVCSQCGRSFPKDQVVMFDNRVICAACKPLFVQRLKEGAGLPGQLRYAGFWIRAAAKIIDLLIWFVIVMVIGYFVGMLFRSVVGHTQNREALYGGLFLIFLIQLLIRIIIVASYNTYFIGRFAATPGKMACRIKVVTPEGGRVSYPRALGRNFAEWLSSTFTLTIGYIMAGFDSEKRALHDRVCSTRVVYR